MACIVTDENAVLENGNQIRGHFPGLINSKIVFEGSGNILYCEAGVRLRNSVLAFHKDNSVIYLSENRHVYYLNVAIRYDSTLFIGKNNYINGTLHLIFSEQKNIVIGDGGLFSFGIWMRLADPHLIYDADTHHRINPSKSIYIGDHVWVGQNVILLRGTQIGSGSIIGAGTVLTGKRPLPSNTIWAGAPARQVRSNIFWTEDCVHGYQEKDTKAKELDLREDFIYSCDETQTIPFDAIEQVLTCLQSPDERVVYLQQLLRREVGKNRFFIDRR